MNCSQGEFDLFRHPGRGRHIVFNRLEVEFDRLAYVFHGFLTGIALADTARHGRNDRGNPPSGLGSSKTRSFIRQLLRMH